MCSKVMDFLTDDDFINYVLGVTPQSASQWETYFSGFSIVENNELKDRIISSIKDFSGIL